MLFSANKLQNSFSKLNYWGGHFVSDLSPTMAFWTDNMSNISDEELFKDDLRLDSILAKEVTVSEDLFDRGSVTSEDVSEVIDLSLLSKRVPSNIEESQAVDLSLRPSKAPCPVSLKEVTLEESSVCPVKSQREGKLLDILRLAGRRRRDQGMLCHLCDLQVSFYTFTTVKYLSHVCYCSLIQHKVALHMPEVDTELHQTCLCADSSTIISD